MKVKSIILTATGMVLFSGVAVWASVSDVRSEIATEGMSVENPLIPEAVKPIELEHSDYRSRVPDRLLTQLKSPTKTLNDEGEI